MNPQPVKYSWAILLFLILTGGLNSLQGQLGNSPILNIPSSAYYGQNYTSSPQNWGIIQHQDGRIYLGNTSGVLVWDGNHWEMVAGTENKRFFKFAADRQGRIYTAGSEDLGYLGADANGKPSFHSIKEELPDSLQNFDILFRVASNGEHVYFLGRENLFRWSQGSFRCWYHPEKFSRIFISQGRVFVTTKTELYELVDQQLNLLIPESSLNGLQVRGLSLLSRPETNDQFWIATANQGLFTYSRDKLSPLNPGLDSLSIMNVCEVDAKHFALGTNGQGLFIVDHQGNVDKIFNKESGLLDDQIPFPYKGLHNSLWVCQYNGLSKIAFPSPFALYGLQDNSAPIVLSTYQWKDKMLLGTIKGAFLIDKSKSSTLTQLALSPGQVHGFFELDASLFMVSVIGIYQLKEGTTFSSSLPIRGIDNFCRSSVDSTVLYFCSDDLMLRSLRYKKGSWQLANDSTRIPHYGTDMIHTEDGTIWFAYDQLSSVSFSEAGPILKTYGPSEGVPEGEGFLDLQILEDKLVLTGDIGIREWAPDQGKFVPMSDWGDEFAEGDIQVYNLTPTQSGTPWMTSNQFTGPLQKVASGKYSIDSLLLSSFPITDYFSIYEAPDSSIWLGGTEGVIQYNPRIPLDYQPTFHTLIRQVTAKKDSVLFGGTFTNEKGAISSVQPETAIPYLPYQENNLSFRYAAPYFEALERLEYSHQLLGQDEDWTPWSTKTETEYTNIREGSYTFQVKARNVYGAISNVATYQFKVSPPWYRSWWAFALYILLAGLAVLLIVRLNTNRLRAAKRKLEGIVEERTAEIQRQLKLLASQKEVISSEKEKSEQLLLNILPQATTEELKAHGSARPRYFDQVSVLFTDFKGFTQIAESLSPKALVDVIHHSFSAFDSIARAHGIEKIKTIGDAYMAAGGLPTPNSTHPVDVVTAALEIRDFILTHHQERVAQGLPGFEIRLGIHTGPVVAGIVGLHKFQYDIWGDTVNLAARMESSGEIGKVNISQSTYDLVKDHFSCTYRGEIEAKNKGKIAMYFVDWAE